MPQEPRVLILEDMPTDAELAERELRGSGMEFISKRVDSKEAFLEALTSFSPDVILSDYGLPQFDGLEALRIVKALGLDTPLILVTGSLTEELAVECMKEGAADYVLKTSLRRLPSSVHNALEKSQTRRAQEAAIAALRRSEEKYRNVVDNIREVIFQTDIEGVWTFLNRAWSDVTRFTVEDSIGLSFLDFVHPEDKARCAAGFQKLIEQGVEEFHDEVRCLTSDDEYRWIAVRARLTISADAKVVGVSGSLIDITQRKHAEESLQQSEEKLRQSQKLEAVGQLAGGIAHDFNNLLTAIMGYSELALRRLTDEDPLHRNIEEIRKAGERAGALTRQLLAFSRKQILQPKVLDLNTIVADLDKMLRRVIGEDISIVTSLEPDLNHVKADAGQIEQVVINLSVNARDAMPAGGKLTIETRNVEISEDLARAHLNIRPGQYVMLAVSDNGCGMDSATQLRIFEPFFTTKKIGKGTGLGLSTVYGIVQQSGGTIWVYSELGRGTTFKIYLPIVDEELEALSTSRDQDHLKQGSETILLVEDEDGVRRLLYEVLKSEGYNVIDTGSGPRALEMSAEYKGEIQLLITDVVMPEMSGREVAERITSFRPDTKVIFMSGYTDDSIVHHGVLDSGVEFLQKPFTPRDAARKVRDVLDGSSTPGPARHYMR